ncbi:hypothetical protein M9Y10_042012 [Tritrichomonas musculus]|uniref:Uncharacterized protein n=1 Tax=Tritrichomonas musculus TaxID=1915356 RepID=A0ABR2K6U4_9EUKA
MINQCAKNVKIVSITNDPGDHVEVRVFFNVTISSSIFNKNHVLVINQQSTLTFTNVVKVDSFAFTDSKNVVIVPKISTLTISLSKQQIGLDFAVNTPKSQTKPLKLVLFNPKEIDYASTIHFYLCNLSMGLLILGLFKLFIEIFI